MKFVTVQSLEVSSPFQNVWPPRASLSGFTDHFGDNVGSIFDRLGKQPEVDCEDRAIQEIILGQNQ